LTPLTEGGANVGNPAFHRSLDGGQTWELLAMPWALGCLPSRSHTAPRSLERELDIQAKGRNS